MPCNRGWAVARPLPARGLAVLCAVALAFWPYATVQAEEQVTIDFENVEISEFVKTVSKLTGRNFLIDQAIRGTVTILGPKSVPLSEVWRVFHSVLAVKGLTVVKVGSLYKIVQRRDAKSVNAPVVVGRKPSNYTEQMIIQLVPLEHVEAKSAVDFLKNFAGSNATVFSHDETNTLVIVDDALNVAKLLRLLDQIDNDRFEETVEIHQLQYVDAEEAINLLQQVYQGGGGGDGANNRRRRVRRNRGGDDGGGLPVRLVPYTRLNQIIMIGAEPDIEAMKDMLAEIDVPLPEGSQAVRYYQLKFADAESVASTLNQLLSGLPASEEGEQEQRRRQRDGEGPQIVPDTDNNALIFIAPQEMYQQALSLLKQLDRPRAQVYVEAAILEVTITDDTAYNLGGGFVDEQRISGEQGFLFGGQALGFNPLGVGANNFQAIQGANGLFGGVVVTPGDGTLPPLGAVLQAVATNSDINVLSTPHLLTLDNEEAEIIIGDNVPFLTGQTATSGGNVITSIERQDVGITLRVTPQINDSGEVRMDIFQEISDVSQEAPAGIDVNQQGLTTRRRTARTDVVVASGRTVAIGGLIQERESINETKTPILGDLPIFGWLFKNRNKTKRKTNLINLLSPNVVRTSEELQEQTLSLSERFEQESGGFVGDSQTDYFEALREREGEYDAEQAETQFERDMVIDLGEDTPAPDAQNGTPATAPANTTGAETDTDWAPIEPVRSRQDLGADVEQILDGNRGEAFSEAANNTP